MGEEDHLTTSGSLLQRMKHEELDRQLRKDRLLRDAL